MRRDVGPLRGRARALNAYRMKIGGRIAAVAAAAAVVYGSWIRPRLMRWGATDEEVAGPYPGADLVPDGERGATMAVTIDAPPDQVWPWLVQMGGDRGGWYSWDHLDNAGRPSARQSPPGVARPRPRRLREVLDTQPRPRGRLGGCSAGTESIPGTAWIERSARPQPRPEAATATGLHRRPMGLPVERVAWRAHTSRHRRLSSHPPSMAWTLRQLLALPPGCLDHAGTNVGRTQAKRRASGQGTSACKACPRYAVGIRPRARTEGTKWPTSRAEAPEQAGRR